MKRQWIVLIAVLFVLSLGCSLFGGKATPEPTAEPTSAVVEKTAENEPVSKDDQPVSKDDQPASTEAPTTEDENVPLTFDENALEGLNSYRMDMTWSFTKEDGSVEEFNIQEEATRNPAAQRYTMVSGGESIEFIRIDQTQWMRFGEEWMQTTAGEDEAMSGFGEFFIKPEEMFSGTDSDAYKYMGKDNVNGLNTRHYQIKNNVWNMASAFNADEIEDGSVDVWIVDERDLPKFAARYEVSVTGTFKDEGKGKLVLSWNIYDVNADITIEPPTDVATLPEGVELCPDAADVMVMGTMSVFTCPAPVTDTITFYTESLESNGWAAGDITNLENMLMGTWSKDGESISLTITADDDSGGSNVMITLGE